MYNPVDAFSKMLREKREAAKQTQKGLAAKMGMSHRTIMDTELCRSSPKFETVALLARELDISLDALVFPDRTSPNGIPRCVYDYFRDKTEERLSVISRCAGRRMRSREIRKGGCPIGAAAFPVIYGVRTCFHKAVSFPLPRPRTSRWPCDSRRRKTPEEETAKRMVELVRCPGLLCKIAEQECHNLRTGAVRIGGKGCTRSTLGDPFLGSPQDGIIVVRAVCYIGERIILDFHGVHSIVMIWESIS